MNKGEIIINLTGFETFESIPTKFGNGAHITLPKEHLNKKLKVIVGKPTEIKENKIKIDFFGNEILERKPTKFGTGLHITIPKEYLNQKIKIITEKGVKNE